MVLFYRGDLSVPAVLARGPPPPSLPPFPRSPRLLGAADLDPGHSALTKLTVQPAHQRSCQQPHLGRPGSGVGDDQELSLGETVRAGVRGEVGPDNLGPAAEDRSDRGL